MRIMVWQGGWERFNIDYLFLRLRSGQVLNNWDGETLRQAAAPNYGIGRLDAGFL
jgi:hypothetical protein